MPLPANPDLPARYKERHVIAKRLSLAKDYDWSVKPFIERFGLADIKTADVEDFIADLRKPRCWLWRRRTWQRC